MRTVARSRLLVLSLLLLGTQAVSGQAAPATPKVVRSRATGYVSFLSMSDGSPVSVTPTVANAETTPLDLFVQYGDLFGIDDPVAQLRQARVARDALGYLHTTLEQVHHNVRVFGGVLKTHQNARGEFVVANGRFFPVPAKLQTVPTLDPVTAEGLAELAVTFAEPRIEATELVVVDPGWYGDRPQGAHLAYFIRVVAMDGMSAEGFFIDANSGAVLDRWNLLENVKNREVHDAGGGPDLPGPIARIEGEGPTGEVEVDRAYDYAGDWYDLYSRAFERDSFADNGSKIIATVNSTALNCPNAQWNGTQVLFCTGLTMDDVVAHELTHAVVEYTARLIYQNQPGQLNESYADIFGELVDIFNGNVAFPGPPAGPFWPASQSGPGVDTPNLLRKDECIGGLTVEVYVPVALAGMYRAGYATFGPPLTETGVAGALVTSDPPLACTALSNGAQIAGKIAVVDRGDCNFVVKTKNAQNAGAIGVILVNNRAGAPPNMSGADSTIVIPTVSLAQVDGVAIEAALALGETVSAAMSANGIDGGVRWLVGETAPDSAIRDMWNPPCMGDPSTANHPFQTCDPTDNGGVHSGSGVPNHAFALVTDGGTFNGYTVTGIGPIKSGAVWYRALTTYLTIASDFEDAYTALNQAALDLRGTFPLDPRTGSPSSSRFTATDAAQVDLALQAVEMNTPGACGASTAILNSEPPTLCPFRTNVFNDGFENGPDGWTVANSGPPTPYDWVLVGNLPWGMSGTAWFAEDRNIGDCQTVDESAVHWLTSPSINLPSDATAPMLAFTHALATEPAYDGGNLKISVNGSAFVLIPTSAFTYNPYNSTLDPTGTSPLAGQPAFTGIDDHWGTSVVDLSGFAGPNDTVRFRFDFGKDGCTGYVGWYVSDFTVFNCSPGGNGDLDNDGRVDLKDHGVFQRCFDQAISQAPQCAAGDMNNDGVVNLVDYSLWVQHLNGP